MCAVESSYIGNDKPETPSNYFSLIKFPVNRTTESQKSYKTMLKYIEYFNGMDVVGPVEITSFVRNLYFNTGLVGRPLSRKYISNVLIVVLDVLRHANRLDRANLDFKTLWINIKKERRVNEHLAMSTIDPVKKFSMLNDAAGTEYFKLNSKAVREILDDCRRCLVLNNPEDEYTNTDRTCYAVMLLSIGTGARVVSTILKLSEREVYKLFNTGVVTCAAKHNDRCDIYIAEGLRTEFKDYFTSASRVYPISITRRILVYWYRNYIMTKYGKKLPRGRILHEFRAWFIGHVNDAVGIRAAARSVSHKNVTTTMSYVNRSIYNIDVSSNISKAFQDILSIPCSK